MRVPIYLFTFLLIAGCGGGEEAADAMPEEAPTEMEMEVAGPTLADFAGTWETTATLEGAPDPVPVTIEGTADGAFTMVLEGRDPMTLEASMSGDSLVLVSPEYESVIRDGVTVSTRTAAVMEDGRMTGKLVATYQTAEGTEEVSGTIEGTRGM